MNDTFQFPNDARLKIDQQLRDFVAKDQPLQSVRPERRTTPVIVEPALGEPAPSRAAPANSVPVRDPAPTPVGDPESISIELPSRFHFYSFKDLYVKPFRVRHLAKLAKANETGSLQSIAEAVSSVISSPGYKGNDLAFHLTMADFNAVLYWLRLNSFTQKQMRVTSMCSHPEHVKRVQDKDLPEESLKIQTIYTKSDLKFNFLDSAPDPEYYTVVDDQGNKIDLRPETVLDVMQFLDSPKWQDPEFQYSARIASVLNLVDVMGRPVPLEKRVAVADALPPDMALLALEFAEQVDAYGVVETVKTTCMECGASGAVQIVVDAPCFLSPEF